MTSAADLKRELEQNWWPNWLHQNEARLVDRQEKKLRDWMVGANQNHNSIPDWEGVISNCKLARYELDCLKTAHVDNVVLGAVSRLAANSFILNIGLTRNFPDRGQLRFPPAQYGFILALLVAIGWREDAELVARLAFQDRPTTFLETFPNQRIAWLMHCLTRDWLGIKVELNENLRPEDGLGPWQELVDNWRSRDEEKFTAIFENAADYHVQQSHQYVEEGHIERPDEGPYRSENFEIENPNYWIFPVELLAVLRLREWIGLVNSRMTHQLFATSPLGRLPVEVPHPANSFYDSVEKKFREMFPSTPSLADLPALRKEQGHSDT